MSVVLDASALLAYLQREAGTDVVKAALGEADRACLALGIDIQSPVYTADRIWRQIVLDDVDVEVIR